jgi:DNA-binding MurR/RpiR family transcriptional regulator
LSTAKPTAEEEPGTRLAGHPNAVIQRLKKHIADGNRLSPKYGALADYILHHPDEGAFRTAIELAKAADVSEATVIRFANALSYASYADFRRDFQRWMTDELTTIHRMRDTIEEPARKDSLGSVVGLEVENLQRALSGVSPDDIQLTARLMLEADELFVVGLRASASLARYLAYEAAEVVPRVTPITSGGMDVLASIVTQPSGLMIAFGFPRYPRETVEIMDAGRKAGLSIVSITDSFNSPLTERSDVALLTPVTSKGPVDLYCAPLAIATSIMIEAVSIGQDRALEGLSRFERIAEDIGLYWPTS